MLRITSLRARILLTVSAGMLLSVLVLSYLATNSQRAQLTNHHHEHQYSLLQLVQHAIASAMIRNAPDEIQSTLDELQTAVDIASLKIISMDGEVRYSTNTREVGTRYPENLLLSLRTNLVDSVFLRSTVDDRRILTTITKSRNMPECHACHSSKIPYNGFLAIDSDLTTFNQAIAKSRAIIIVAALISLCVLILTVVLVHVRFVQRGLQKLHNVINEIEGGNMDAHIDLKYTDEMGRLSHAFNSMIDRLNLMRDELKQSHRLQMERADKLASVGEIAAGIAHEIKNPVSGISSAAKILMDEFNSDEEHRPVFQEIVRQTQRVNDAINNLLSFARPREPHFVETDFEFVILRSLKLIREHAKTSRITVEAQALTNIPPVTVDLEQIEQIMVNLMMNAVQAMPEGGTLRILYGYDSERQEVNVQIQDSGIGIPEDNIELVFQPFFTTRHRGTGLGLAIAHNIATSHGGRINVVSRVGSGTTFTVILPVLSTNSADHRDNHEDSTNPHGEA